MGVRLGDDPDAGPAGVPEHHRLDRPRREGLSQERIGGDRRPQRPGVVPELPDLRRRLVDEAQVTRRCAHGHRAEERIGGPFTQVRPQRR